MSKDYSGIRGLKMNLKCRPEIIPPLKWNGPSEQDISPMDMVCAYCGGKMEPYIDYGNQLIWRCFGHDQYSGQPCVNNPDEAYKDPLTFDVIEYSGNRMRRFADWKPPTLI